MVKLDKRPPLQVWSTVLPKYILDEEYRRDLHRAEMYYKRENLIFFSIEVEKVGKWIEHYKNVSPYCMGIPADAINVITVYHIDKLGNIFPPIPTIDKIRKGLYIDWLNSEFEIIPENEPFELISRRLTKKYAYTEKISISPDIAYIKSYKSMSNLWRYNLEKILPKKIISIIKENESSCFRIIFPEPFDFIFPTGGGIYTLYNYYLMKRYLELSLKNKDLMVKIIRSEKTPYLSEISSTINRSWFMPKLYSKTTNILLEIQGKFSLEFKSKKEAMSSIKFMKKIRHNIVIKRIYGWIGYFWWEFYQDLIKKSTVKICKNCGTIINGGRSNRKYCSKEENPDCWKERAALRQKTKYYEDKRKSYDA